MKKINIMAKPIVKKESNEDVIKNEEEIVNDSISEVTEMSSSPIVNVAPPKEEEIESGEILFLRQIINIQESGGWGKHLHPIINDRINKLKNGE